MRMYRSSSLRERAHIARCGLYGPGSLYRVAPVSISDFVERCSLPVVAVGRERPVGREFVSTRLTYESSATSWDWQHFREPDWRSRRRKVARMPSRFRCPGGLMIRRTIVLVLALTAVLVASWGSASASVSPAERLATRLATGSRSMPPLTELRASGTPRVAPNSCGRLVGSKPSVHGVRLRLRLANTTIQQGESGTGTLEIRNVGTRHFTMEPGQPLFASLVTKRTRTVVAQFNGAVAGTGLAIDLPPGRSMTIDVVFGTTPCANSASGMLAPGQYGVRLVLAPEGTGAPSPRLLSPEALINVVEPAK